MPDIMYIIADTEAEALTIFGPGSTSSLDVTETQTVIPREQVPVGKKVFEVQGTREDARKPKTKDPVVLVLNSDGTDEDIGDGRIVAFVRANGLDIQTITIRKRRLFSRTLVNNGTETIRIVPETPITTSAGQVDLVAGTATFTVGPTLTRGLYKIRVANPARLVQHATIELGFK